MPSRPDANLTPAQREAVEHVDGPLLILAGPGSGKTRVVTQRIAHLLEVGVSPRQILALTFTNKSAEEMKSRVARLAPGKPVWMSTFHRFCSRLLRQYAGLVGLTENFTIYDTDDSRRVLKQVIRDNSNTAFAATPEAIAAGISWAKSSLMTAENYAPQPGHPLGAVLAKLYPAYQELLLRSNAVDFDDLLLHVATMLRENSELRADLDQQFRYILVDEYQDTNLAQYAIVRALSIDAPNLAVTGDPDQSIYGWRGANIRNILDFEKDYPEVKVVRLERNYRSSGNILQVADRLISHNKQRKEKSLYTEKEGGQPVRLVTYSTHQQEAEGIVEEILRQADEGRRLNDFAIFYRVNALSRSLEHALRRRGVAFQIVNGLEFYQRKEIKDVLAYLGLINNPCDDVAFRRIVNTPVRGIGLKSIERVAEHANRNRIPLLEAARESGLIETLRGRAPLLLAKFVALYDRLREHAHDPIEEVIGHVLEESGYRQKLIDSDLEEDQERLANIEELLTAAREFDVHNPGEGHLEAFLEQASLVNDIDVWEEEIDQVTLMTMHAAKGLEFPVVFIVAIEDGLIPHERSREHPNQLEEERRLLFVGVTRAEEQLHLSYAKRRNFRGRDWPTIASSFLTEMPLDDMEHVSSGGGGDASQFDPWDDSHHFETAEASDVPEGFEAPAVERTAPTPAMGQLKTAADLLPSAGPVKPRPSPEIFTLGMVVTHPTYGPGKILGLSGTGQQRTASVQFATVGEKKFRLAFSELRPAGGR